MWDFNVAPQMSVLSAQIDYENRKVYILEEILGKPEEKENNTPALARKVRLKLYRDKHIGGVDVTGDPSGLQRSTTNEDGINNYTIITDTFGRGILRPKVKLLRKQPPQATRCEFVNEVFGGYEGWEIQIDIKCRKLTQDLIYQLRNEDGTKSKQKTTDPKPVSNMNGTGTCPTALTTCSVTTCVTAGTSSRAEATGAGMWYPHR